MPKSGEGGFLDRVTDKEVGEKGIKREEKGTGGGTQIDILKKGGFHIRIYIIIYEYAI